MTAVLAVRDYIAGMWPDPIPPRCGIAVCGGARLGVGSYWPSDTFTIPARCGLARCGASYCGRIAPNHGLFAGSLPVMYSHAVTIGLTELMGGEADPRQRYDTAYDNPGIAVHVVGDDLAQIDRVAEAIRERLDMARHITTPHGIINGMSCAPGVRRTRADRPRYEIIMTVEAEYVRPIYDMDNEAMVL